MGCAPAFSCDMTVVQDRVTLKRLFTDIAGRDSVVGLPVLSWHTHGLWVSQHSLDFALFFLHRLKEMFCCIRAAVFDWQLCLDITPHRDVAVTASLMLLCSSGVTFCGVELRSLNLGGESLKVCIDDVWGRQLFVVILEGELVLIFLWHLHPDSRLADALALGFVGLQLVFPSVAV